MNISKPFISRPVATTLLTIALALAGGIAFKLLPVAPLPQVDFPTISVNAYLPGASPETMASAVATPLERQFGHIAGVTEMTSASLLGSCSITVQFDLNRNVDAAARDIQAAINAARGYLPANLPSNPSYRKVNPADSPIFMLALTSDVFDRGRMYDFASTIMAQKLAQLQGVGQVAVTGSALPGVRIELNPTALNRYGIGLEDVRTVLNSANANTPKGHFSDGKRMWEVGANDQLLQAINYAPLIVAYHNGSAVRISDVGQAVDSVEDVRSAGFFNGRPAVLVIVFRQPAANIIETVANIRAALPQLEAAIPRAIKVNISLDQTEVIQTSVRDVERSLLISIILVVAVVFVFLKNAWTTLIPSVAVPVSLLGTFGVMYLCGYTLDNLSLMALTICTGFVVDDAIVVIENITRYLEQGLSAFQAALRGAREIGFTVLTMSVSLVAVFIPLLMMGGVVGRLFREFAVTLSVAIAVSLIVSLTTTPMMCAHLLKHRASHGWLYRTNDRIFNWIVSLYGRTLSRVLRRPAITLMVLLATIALNVYLFVHTPKGFFPQQDGGRLLGSVLADQDTSFQGMQAIVDQMVAIVKQDPAVESLNGYVGGVSGGGQGATTNTGRIFVTMTPLGERKESGDDVLARLRPKLAKVPGASLYMQVSQDLRVGGRGSSALYQFTMQSDNLQDLAVYCPRMLREMRRIPDIVDANTDQQNNGLQSVVEFDRRTASRFGISPQLIDNTLYDAFGQRQVSTMYTPLNQYHVVMEVAPQFGQGPQFLRQIYVRSPGGQEVPLTAFTRYLPDTAPLAVNHQGLFPSVTISFNLTPGAALSEAVDAIDEAAARVAFPSTIHTTFAGTAQAYQDALSNQPLLIAAALASVYIVLGILYESYIHPITILSTLPSAGVGALLALKLCHTDLSIIAMIGIILLIGIVKKNAILMIDFAVDAERNENKTSHEAIYEACLLRFRPILMTTMAALLGAMPLALGSGVGSELRRPLGITIIGGLIVSQLLTLYTTPVVYIYLDRLHLWWERVR